MIVKPGPAGSSQVVLQLLMRYLFLYLPFTCCPCSSVVFILTICHVFTLLLNWFDVVIASNGVHLFQSLNWHFRVHLQLVLICVGIRASNFFHVVDLGDVCHTFWAGCLQNVNYTMSSRWLGILCRLVAEKALVLGLSCSELLQGIGLWLTSEHMRLDSCFGLGCRDTLFIDWADRALILFSVSIFYVVVLLCWSKVGLHCSCSEFTSHRC